MLRHVFFLSVLLGSASLSSAQREPASAASVQAWFESALKGAAPDGPAVESRALSAAGMSAARAEVFAAYKLAAVKLGWEKNFTPTNKVNVPVRGKLELTQGSYHIKEGLDMPYLALAKGKKPDKGWPLFIAMHGGGGTGEKLATPHSWDVNSSEWDAQVRLSLGLYPNDAIYFVPRMVDDNQGRWWKEFNVTAFSAMIRHAILFWDIDPNRVYLIGISEGGYGTETLACRYPDLFAAANGMACGSGTSIHVENLRNLPFRTDVGERDTMFGRVTNAVAKHELLETLRQKDPHGYTNHLEVHPGKGHGINYQPGPNWLLPFSRSSHPDRVTVTLFQHDEVKNKGAYWLHAVNDLDKKVIYLDARINTQENSIAITATATKNDESVQAADWQKPLADSGETIPASGLKLRLWLHESLLDLAKPVRISINGKPVQTLTPAPQLSTLCESLLLSGDPEFSYPAKAEVTVP
jgi:predicted esterase